MFKYVKFGFGQVTDHVGYDLREGFITKNEGKYLIKELDGRCGKFYIDWFCKQIDITPDEMYKHMEIFRGEVFTKDKNGKWILKNPIWEQEPIEGNPNIQDIMRRLGI